MPNIQQLMGFFEVHDVDGIRSYFATGGDPNAEHNGVAIFDSIVEMYFRSPRFTACIRQFIEAGLIFDDAALLAVLADDAPSLEKLLQADPGLVNKKIHRFRNTFTSLNGGSLLHYCAEYNAISTARILVRYGADVNEKAGVDQHGFGGHTPIFHTVCQLKNNSSEILSYLLEQKADLLVTVKGLVWGEGYEWETFIPAVNPLSYAMMGLLPQMHRSEATVASVVSLLLKHLYNIDYTLPNIPNAYIARG